MESKFLGLDKNQIAYYGNSNYYVAIDTTFNAVTEQGEVTNSISEKISTLTRNVALPIETIELAISALSLITPNTNSLLASARLYSIPSGVRLEAKKALDWHKEHHRGGTPVGLNTARTLARGGQIGIEKVRHIAKYFPRHEVDKKGKGWEPGEDNFPSNGRIAWALWGGDAAWRWAKAIVERENAHALKADAGYSENIGADISPFEDAQGLDDSIAPDFLARVRLDGSGIDRIYKVDLDGQVYAWDDGTWDDLGHAENGDIWTYDKALDDPYDLVEKTHVQIDPESAIIICARLNTNPFKNISIDEIDEDEARMAADAAKEEDWDFIDVVITAAGEGGGAVSKDGNYTPQERSQNASKQVRDGGGRFATQGKNVSVKGQGNGTITNVDQGSGNVTVKLANGQSVVVPAKDTKQTEEQDVASPLGPYNQADLQGPLDVSGILGEPRTPQNMPKAHLPGTYPPIKREDLHKLLADFPAWVREQRAQFNGTPQQPNPNFSDETAFEALSEFDNSAKDSEKEVEDKSDTSDEKPTGKKMGRPPKPKVDPNSYHPLLRQWERSINPETPDASDTKPEDAWAKPVTAAGDKTKGSDVQPVYLAIVSPDDPRAVIECVSLVPSSATSNQPMTYVRRNKKWERDPKFLEDLKSATPPPVVPLKPDVLNDVLIQIDGLTASLAFSTDLELMVLFGPRVEIIEEFSNLETLYAAGGLDRNRGNAEKLRRYWAHGEGAAKIRWGTPGDWTRCVRHLSKFLGVRAKGYCQLRHKEATGEYTATHAKHDREHSVKEFIMEEVLTKNYGVPTVVTDRDMLTPVTDILRQPKDDIYDEDWQPPLAIIEALSELSKCSDEEFDALVAAGGFDRNRGKAEKLRRYWTIGRGGRRKIKWNTGGDWTRCVRHLSKYLGPRAKGYCALRHKEMTGLWTGDKEHIQRFGGKRSHNRNHFSNEVINSTEKISEVAYLTAEKNDLSNKVALVASSIPGLVQSAPPKPVDGERFSIPLVIPEQVESGDGRKFKQGAITWRELPLPLMWQVKTSSGHDGSVVVGRIDHIERVDGGVGNCHGVFDTSPHALEVVRLIRNGFIRGTSADMDKFEATEEKPETENAELEKPSIDKKEVGKDKLVISKGRIMAITIVPKPAFQECKIFLTEEPENNNNPQQEEPVINDGIYVDDADEFDAMSLIACGMVAGAVPINPPSDWFKKPVLNGPTPLTVTDEGQVYGHIASWETDHIGLARGTKPPKSRSGYAYFHTGVCRTAEGTDIPVGQLTLAGGHASLEASASEAVKHYDDTASAVADVHAGEDQYGIYVAGALRPGATPDQIRSLRASAPSGDWRPIRGSLELVAVCQVNVPGFPIARARVASGAVMALVAAGAATLAKMKSDPVSELNARLKKLEGFAVADKLDQVEAIKAKFAEFKTQPVVEVVEEIDLVAKAQELSAKFQTLTASAEEDVFANIPMVERQKLAKSGKAMPGGSFPIRNAEDLKNAIHAFGRAKESERADVKRHIIKRARALGKSDLIPESWGSYSSKAVTASTDELKARLAAAEERLGKAQATEFAEAPMPVVPSSVSEVPQQVAYDPANPVAPVAPEADGQIPSTPEAPAPNDVESGLLNPETGRYTPKTQPRDENGKFRQVLARLKQDLGTAGLQNVLDEAKKVDKLHSLGSYVEAANASVNLQDILGRLDSGALNNKALENVRSSAKELGTVIANLPLGFNNQAEKVRYSDLPPALKDLMDNMVSKVEAKIGKKDADIATQGIREFKNGSDVFNQSDISSEMSKLLRLLT
jgi:hypothetical protein